MQPRSYRTVEIAQRGPSDRFRHWVEAYGVIRLGQSLRISRRNVHLWRKQVDPDVPRLATAKTIIALSEVEPLNIGPLTYEDLFGEIKIISHSSHAYKSKLAPRQILSRRSC
jgi:hypothetical protein